jgi:hypothetical protein
MKTAFLILGLLTLDSCGAKDKGKADDAITGGEEKLIDSFSCVAHIDAYGKDGKPDPVRGFDFKFLTFEYEKGSVASTMQYDFTFASKEKTSETVTRLYPQNETKHHLETDLILAKLDVKGKSVTIFTKYDLSENFEGDCK